MPLFNPAEEEHKICHFPKHKGKLWKEIAIEDPDYIEFLLYESDRELPSDLVDYLEDLLDEGIDA